MLELKGHELMSLDPGYPDTVFVWICVFEKQNVPNVDIISKFTFNLINFQYRISFN